MQVCCAYSYLVVFAGYSATTASLHALNGYDATYMRWAGTDDMFTKWKNEQAFEFLWEPSSARTGMASNNSRGADNRILTHIMKHNYGDLAGLSNGTLRFTWESDPFPVYELKYVAEEESEENQRHGYSGPHFGTSMPGDPVDESNVHAYAKLFLEFIEDRRAIFQGPILAVWGADYRFTDASVMFGNMSLIINHINKHPVRLSIHQ